MEESQEKIPEERKMYKKRINNRFINIALIIFLAFGVFQLGYQKGKSEPLETLKPIPLEDALFENKNNQADNTIDFSLFWNVWNLLEQKYVDAEKLDAKKLFYGAIRGMMEATGDPYTTFLEPTENKKFSEDISGNFEGIGAELGIKGGILTIVAPLQGSPAEKAGLRSGDKIIKIDGNESGDMGIEEAVDNIRGPKNTSVTLTIFREGEQDTQEIKIQRGMINVKSVVLEFKENNIANIKITRFGDDTTKGFADAIAKVRAQKSQGLIIDLRNNPGGYLESAVDIASKLLPRDQVVVIEETGDRKQKKMLSRGGDVASGLETVILINEGSASASEILAGALKDNRSNVTLVGKKSFGKGSVQEFIEMPNGTAAKITIAHWLTPKGTQINKEGIKPDKEVELSNDDYNANRDPQFDAAIQELKEKLQKK